MLAKLIVTGTDRAQALERSRRALDELTVEGLATVVPFHLAIVRDPAFTESFTVHTRWIETEFDNRIPPFEAPDTAADSGETPESRQTVVVEVDGRRLEVSLPGDFALGGGNGGATKAKPRKRAGGPKTAAGGNAVTAPMQGT